MGDKIARLERKLETINWLLTLDVDNFILYKEKEGIEREIEELKKGEYRVDVLMNDMKNQKVKVIPIEGLTKQQTGPSKEARLYALNTQLAAVHYEMGVIVSYIATCENDTDIKWMEDRFQTLNHNEQLVLDRIRELNSTGV